MLSGADAEREWDNKYADCWIWTASKICRNQLHILFVVYSFCSVSNDEAKELWPDGWEEPKPYIRIVPQPDTTRVEA